MNEREVLKMLKSKIDAAAKVGCNYAIETEDEDAINKALNTPAVVCCTSCKYGDDSPCINCIDFDQHDTW